MVRGEGRLQAKYLVWFQCFVRTLRCMKSFPWGSKIHGFVNRQALPIGRFSLPPSQKISGRDRFGFTRIVRSRDREVPGNGLGGAVDHHIAGGALFSYRSTRFDNPYAAG